MTRKTRRGGRATPPTHENIVVAPPVPHEENSPVDNILLLIVELNQDEKSKLYEEAYTHGDLSSIQSDPNASEQYNQVVQLINQLSDEDFDDLTGRIGDVLEGGRRRRKKRTRRAKKTRKYRC